MGRRCSAGRQKIDEPLLTPDAVEIRIQGDVFQDAVSVPPEQRLLDKRFENVIVHKLGIDEHEWYVPGARQKYQ